MSETTHEMGVRVRTVPYVGARAGIYSPDGADLGTGTVTAVETHEVIVLFDNQPDAAITARVDCLSVLATVAEQIAHAQAAAYVWRRQDAGESGQDTGRRLPTVVDATAADPVVTAACARC
jgi:hypothetical protein